MIDQLQNWWLCETHRTRLVSRCRTTMMMTMTRGRWCNQSIDQLINTCGIETQNSLSTTYFLVPKTTLFACCRKRARGRAWEAFLPKRKSCSRYVDILSAAWPHPTFARLQSHLENVLVTPDFYFSWTLPTKKIFAEHRDKNTTSWAATLLSPCSFAQLTRFCLPCMTDGVDSQHLIVDKAMKDLKKEEQEKLLEKKRILEERVPPLDLENLTQGDWQHVVKLLSFARFCPHESVALVGVMLLFGFHPIQPLNPHFLRLTSRIWLKPIWLPFCTALLKLKASIYGR